MIGIGTWKCHVDTMMFAGDIKFRVADNGGQYEPSVLMDGPVPAYTIKSITEENGDTLHIVANVEMLKNRDIEITVTFNGDTCTGFVKVPFLGKIKLENGVRIEE